VRLISEAQYEHYHWLLHTHRVGCVGQEANDRLSHRIAELEAVPEVKEEEAHEEEKS